MLCQVCPPKLHTSVFLRSGRLLVTQESLLWLSCWASCSCCGRACRGTKVTLNPCRLLARMLCDMAIGTRLNSSLTLKRTACRARLSLMVAFRRRLSVCLFFSTWPQWDQEGLARFGCLETSAHHVPCSWIVCLICLEKSVFVSDTRFVLQVEGFSVNLKRICRQPITFASALCAFRALPPAFSCSSLLSRCSCPISPDRA